MRWLLAVGAALVLAPAATAALPNPCGLLTKGQVTQLLGTTVVTRQLTGSPIYRLCRWSGKPPASGAAAQRTLMLAVSKVSKAEFQRRRNVAPGAVPVSGIGESAFRIPQGGNVFLNVWQGGYALELATTLAAAPLTIEKSAASTALGHLPLRKTTASGRTGSS